MVTYSSCGIIGKKRVRIRILSQILTDASSWKEGRDFDPVDRFIAKFFGMAMFLRDLSTDMDRVLQEFGNVSRISVSRMFFFPFFLLKIPYKRFSVLF